MSTSLDEILRAECPAYTSPTTFSFQAPSVKKPITCYLWRSAIKAKPEPDSIHLVVATHGAGGDSLSAACTILFEGLSKARDSVDGLSMAVLSFDGSMNLKGRTTAFLAVIDFASASASVKKITLAGRSMGCRAAALAYSESPCPKLSKLLLLQSYPLQGNKPDVRKQPLLDLDDSANVLFVGGSEDEMCPVSLLKPVLANEVKAMSAVLEVLGLDHGMTLVSSVKVTSSKKDASLQIGRKAAEVAASWLDDPLDGGFYSTLQWTPEGLDFSGWKQDESSSSESRQKKRSDTATAAEPDDQKNSSKRRRKK